MLDKIQTKIDSLSVGKKLILGAGIRAEEFPHILSLCESLQTAGVIKIVNAQSSAIIIEKV
jgi:hypothetical protein